jgi:hypothetical protein
MNETTALAWGRGLTGVHARIALEFRRRSSASARRSTLLCPSEIASPHEARAGLSRYRAFYNHERPHQALAYRAPAEVYVQQPLVV